MNRDTLLQLFKRFFASHPLFCHSENEVSETLQPLVQAFSLFAPQLPDFGLNRLVNSPQCRGFQVRWSKIKLERIKFQNYPPISNKRNMINKKLSF